MSTYVFNEAGLWVPSASVAVGIEDAWFRLPAASGTVARWSLTDLSTALVDTVSGYTLAPYAGYPDVFLHSHYGVPGVASSATGFLAAEAPLCAIAGDVTIELIMSRHSTADDLIAFASYVGPASGQSNNKLWAFGSGGYNTTLRWVQESGSGTVQTYDGGYGADVGAPIYYVGVRAGSTVSMYANAQLGYTAAIGTPDGGDDAACRLCIGGTIDAGIIGGTVGLVIFSAVVTARAMSAAEILSRWEGTLANHYR